MGEMQRCSNNTYSNTRDGRRSRGSDRQGTSSARSIITVTSKVCAVIGIFMAFFGMGLGTTLLGATLPQLSEQISLPIRHTGVIVGLQAVGGLVGSVAVLVLRQWALHLCPFVVFLMGSSVISVPWCHHASTLAIALVVNGMAGGALVVGAILFSNKTWGTKNGTIQYIRATSMIILTGSMFVPVLLQPFTESYKYPDQACHYYQKSITTTVTIPTTPAAHDPYLEKLVKGQINLPADSSDSELYLGAHIDKDLLWIDQQIQQRLELTPAQPVEVAQSTGSPSQTHNGIPSRSSLDSNIPPKDENDPPRLMKSKAEILLASTQSVLPIAMDSSSFYIVYLLVGLLDLLAALLLILGIIYFKSNRMTEEKPTPHSQNNTEEEIISGKYYNRDSCLFIGLCALFLFGHGGIQFTYGQLILSFVVDHLCWDYKTALFLMTLYWGGHAVGSGAGIFISHLGMLRTALALHSGCTVLALLVFVIMLPFNPSVVWVSTAALGLGLSYSTTNCLEIALKNRSSTKTSTRDANPVLIVILLASLYSGKATISIASCLLIPYGTSVLGYTILAFATTSFIFTCILYIYNSDATQKHEKLVSVLNRQLQEVHLQSPRAKKGRPFSTSHLTINEEVDASVILPDTSCQNRPRDSGLGSDMTMTTLGSNGSVLTKLVSADSETQNISTV